MNSYFIYSSFAIIIAAFMFGTFFGIFISNFAKRKNYKAETLLDELKKNLNEYYIQNNVFISEVKSAIQSTNELKKVLGTSQNLKGIYGENCLENVLNYCFPNKNIDYIKQFNTINENGQKIIPDYLIKLPNNKSLIIDCKLKLEKFIEFQNAPKELKKDKKQDFIRDLLSTINLLSNKKYESAQNVDQPDFILMYIPLEALISLIYTDNDFLNVIKTANEKNIIIVGNSSVITTLRLVNLLWAKEKQEKNIENIVRISQNIYKYFALHSKKLIDIKNSINEANNSINKEFEKLSAETKLFKELEELNSYDISPGKEKTGKKLEDIKIAQEFLK